ncbi:transcriptional regulator GcvA [soil metagenome]
MSPLPPLAAVRVFEAAARLENFTAAANELGMTQAAVSYQVKLLEERLGLSLFHRVGRKVALTDRGRSLAPVIIRAFDEMRQGFATLAGEDSAVLTISCTNSFANLWLAPRLGIFQMRQPGLAVRIHSSDTLADFARDGVDMAIRGGKGVWPGLDARLLAHNRLAPLCSPAYRAANGPIVDARALRSLTLLSPDDIWWGEWFSDMGVEPDRAAGPPEIALDSQVMEGRAAIAGQGVAILNTYLWKAEIEAGLLIEAVPSNVVESRSYWVVYPRHARNTPKIKAFRDWIVAEFAAEMAKDPQGRFMPRR